MTDTSRFTILKTLIPIAAIIGVVIIALTVLKSTVTKRSGESVPIEAGATLPDFTLKKYPDGSVSISKIPAKVLMVNFWASWCQACIVEMPSIIQLRKEFHGQGFEVAFINLDDQPDRAIHQGIPQFGIDFPMYKDPDGELADLFDVHAIPLTVLIDQNRKILLVESGERDWNSDEVRSQLRSWLSQ